jgi:hypothetical protein
MESLSQSYSQAFAPSRRPRSKHYFRAARVRHRVRCKLAARERTLGIQIVTARKADSVLPMRAASSYAT